MHARCCHLCVIIECEFWSVLSAGQAASSAVRHNIFYLISADGCFLYHVQMQTHDAAAYDTAFRNAAAAAIAEVGENWVSYSRQP